MQRVLSQVKSRIAVPGAQRWAACRAGIHTVTAPPSSLGFPAYEAPNATLPSPVTTVSYQPYVPYNPLEGEF